MNTHVAHPFKAKVDRILERCGGYYLFEDIVEYVKSGKMQGHVFGDSWAVTEIIDTPRKRVVNVVLVVGRLSDMVQLDAQVTEWAEVKMKADMMVGHARNGWKDFGKEQGWRNVSAVYMKDLG